MTLSDVSIRHPVFAWMLMAALIVFGLISYVRLGISQLPDVDFPVITVNVTWRGAPPDVMEAAVADIVEDAVMGVDGVKLVTSTSQEGTTQVRIEFDLDRDIDVALEEVRTKISQSQRDLPDDIDPPIITKTNPEDQPILWIAAYGASHTLRDVALYVRDRLKDAITTVNGVGDVRFGGFVDPQMRVWLYNDKMVRNEVTAQDVINAVNTGNILSPTGYQDSGAKETFVRVRSEFRNAKECEALQIPTREGRPIWTGITIGDVARCEEGTDEIRRISRYMGIQPTIGLGVIKRHGANAVEVADEVKAKIKTLEPELPPGLKVGPIVDNTTFIRDSIHELVFTLGLAVILTSIVCYLFLGNWSTSLNVILAIPVSLVGALTFLAAFGFTLNSFTLLALTLSIGIVVDDAIMVLENIVRHREEGHRGAAVSRVRAAMVGARQITSAAVAASVAILAIFVPVVFMQGIVGKFFFQFGIALSVAVMLSLLEALTLAPMRCSQFLADGHENRVTRRVNRGMEWLKQHYRRALGACLRHRWKVVGAAFAGFALSLLVIPSLRKEFLPPQDQSRFMVTLYTPMGSSIGSTDSVFRAAEAILKERPEVDTYYVAVGGFGGGLVNQGIMFVILKEPGQRGVHAPFTSRPNQQRLMEYFRGRFKKMQGVDRVAMLDLSLTGFSAQRGYPIEFQVQGPDWEKLTKYSDEIRARIARSGLMSDIDTDYRPNMPEIEITPNRPAAAERGVTISSISETIAAMVGGLRLIPNKYTDASGHRDDIQVKLVENQNETPTHIRDIWVRNVQGEIVPLDQIVELAPTNALLTVTRYNRQRGIGIFGNFAEGKSQSDVIEGIQKIASEVLPRGYGITLSGSSQAFGESFRSLIFALVLGIVVAYMVLASQFNSFLHPVTILLALPFSVTGALLAMRITDTSLNIYSMIGLLLLMGIVKKNSILLVDFTNARRREGRSVHEALLEACPVRLRPILMTSIATVTAAIPEALALGAGAEIIRPMAIAVIGGVILSTLLTLFVVPCAYSLFSRFEGHRHEGELREALAELGEKAA